jgi:predicted phosphodiesterase
MSGVTRIAGAVVKRHRMGLAMTLLSVLALGCAQAPEASNKSAELTLPAGAHAPVTVAFLGDQGLGYASRRVLQLVKQVGAELVVHAGDLDYHDDPAAWYQQMTDMLGRDFPYLIAIGNHDTAAWTGYQAVFRDHLMNTPALKCQGDLAVQSTCTYKGLGFILSGVGTQGDPDAHVAYLRSQLAQLVTPWRVCVWHKNRRDLQVGRKDNEVPIEAYEACRLGGAMVVNGHSHTYSRTHLLDDYSPLHVVSTDRSLRLEPGYSLTVVTGLGGKSIRPQRREGSWWASIYTEDQGAEFGALFCTFYRQGEEDRARCWFQAVDGTIPDRFDLIKGSGKPG